MKIGWLVWRDEGDTPEFYEEGSEPSYAWKKVRIVYAIIDD